MCILNTHVKLQDTCLHAARFFQGFASAATPFVCSRTTCWDSSSKLTFRRLPQGYVLRRIKPTDRVTALRDWSARFMECEEAFVRLCDVLPSLAVYKVCESDYGGCEEELASSALLRSNGEIGMTATRESHRRMGLATFLTWQLTKLASEEMGLAFVTITRENKTSRHMHENLGYRSTTQVRHIVYAPHDFDADWIENE